MLKAFARIQIRRNCALRLVTEWQVSRTSSIAFSTLATQTSNVLQSMEDEQLVSMVSKGAIRVFDLEDKLQNLERAVRIRRRFIEHSAGVSLNRLPYTQVNYEHIHGRCCENVIGALPVPVGVVGPLLVDGRHHHVPMATTEGALVASTSRGCKALSLSGGTRTEILRDAMTRAPVLSAPDVRTAVAVKRFIDEQFAVLSDSFNGTSRFARLQQIRVHIAGTKLFVRFECSTGEAMGMNMVGKGVERCVQIIVERFPSVSCVSLSGNVCVDKKPSAINWIEGRGKSIVADAVVRRAVVADVLKSSVERMCRVNYHKNLVGSAVSASIGGQNAHASNIVTAVFLATGQDVAQNVSSSQCLTLLEPTHHNEDLHISVSMPSLEVGTIGGGTSLPAQSSMLQLLLASTPPPSTKTLDSNACRLARVIASTVMAGELSLLAALSSGHLIDSHLRLNRGVRANRTHV